MELLLKNYCMSYVGAAGFFATWAIAMWLQVSERINSLDGKILRRVLNVSIPTIMLALLLFFFIPNAWRASASYYDYTHSAMSDISGEIEAITREGKDMLRITVSGKEYISYLDNGEFAAEKITRKLRVGDYVLVKVGVHSNCIFTIEKNN